MAQHAVQGVCNLTSLTVRIVDSINQCDFERHTAMRYLHIVSACADYIGYRILLIGGNQFVAQVLVGRMKRHREIDLQILLGETLDTGNDADC